MNNKAFDVSEIYYAVIDGEDERGNAVYGEPKKLFNNQEQEEEE